MQSYRLFKTLREGCLAAEKGLDLPEFAEPNGEETREEGTEVIG